MNSTTLINKARAYCEQRGARFTPLREKVYEILLGKHGPMGAYELLDALKETESSAKPATVYRALDFLQQHGLVHRIASLNAFVGCTHTDKNHHGLFLICRCCGNVLELTAPGVSDAVQSAAADEAFQPDNMTIEVSGICPGCKSDTAHD